MAEFQEVMKQYNRMFEAHKQGVSIPVEASYETAVKQPDFFEEVVMSWAEEHPEPVYPTWGEFLYNLYPMMGPSTITDILEFHVPPALIERLEFRSVENKEE